jgi:DNA-directed RNA polymerase beta subunit
MRSPLGDSAKTFNATKLLKAFGMSDKEILNIFGNIKIIKNTLALDKTSPVDLEKSEYVKSIQRMLESANAENFLAGSPVETKIKKAIKAKE